MKRAALVACALAACKPELDDDAARADVPRVLAIRIDPPEAKPGERVTLRALTTDGVTVPATEPVALSFCLARKALAESGSIAAECLRYDDARVPLAGAADASGVVPKDACRVFGPEPPLATTGEPAGRPADRDPTGGYYQPGLVKGLGAGATFDVRLRCGLPGATQAQTTNYEARYRPNQNPVFDALDVVRDGRATPLVDDLPVAPGATVRLRAAWAPSVAEDFVAFDPQTRTLVDRREALRVSWLATRGRFASARTGRDEADRGITTENDFTAPAEEGSLVVVVVLRDSRGGTDFRAVRIAVR